MAPFQMADPLGTGAGIASAFLEGQQGAKDRKRQQQLEDDDLKQRAAANAIAAQYESARFENEQARTKTETGKLSLDRREAGLDPATGEPLKLPPGVAPGTPAYTNWLISQGAVKPAASANAQARNTTTATHDTNRDALAFQQFAEKQINDAAQRNHWSAEDVSRARAIATGMQIAVLHGQTSLQDAMIHANAQLQAAAMSQAGQNTRAGDRNAITTRGQNLSHQDRVTGQALGVERFNAGQQNAAARQQTGLGALAPAGSAAPAAAPVQTLLPPGTIDERDPKVRHAVEVLSKRPKAQRLGLLKSSKLYSGSDSKTRQAMEAAVQALP